MLERRNVISQRAVATIEEIDGKPHCIGYSAVFYRAGDSGTEFRMQDPRSGRVIVERVASTAFNSIQQDDVRGLFNHNASSILGRNTSGTMKLDVDDIGLRYDITLPDTQAAADLIVLIQRGDVSGSSFAFRDAVSDWDTERIDGESVEVRNLVTVTTADVGPVTYPAYTATSSDLAFRSLDSYHSEISKANQALLKRRARVQRLRAG